MRLAGIGVKRSLPVITYESGSLANPNIRAAVCRLLEGGKRAFLERERRYRLDWGASESTDLERGVPALGSRLYETKAQEW